MKSDVIPYSKLTLSCWTEGFHPCWCLHRFKQVGAVGLEYCVQNVTSNIQKLAQMNHAIFRVTSVILCESLYSQDKRVSERCAGFEGYSGESP